MHPLSPFITFPFHCNLPLWSGLLRYTASPPKLTAAAYASAVSTRIRKRNQVSPLHTPSLVVLLGVLRTLAGIVGGLGGLGFGRGRSD